MTSEKPVLPSKLDGETKSPAICKPSCLLTGGPLLRWCSEPVSLTSSASSDTSYANGVNAITDVHTAIVALQCQLDSARERCRHLEAELAAEKQNAAAGIKAVVSCVELGKTENQQLQTTIAQQKRYISKLRHQLLAVKNKQTTMSGLSNLFSEDICDDDMDCADTNLAHEFCSKDDQERIQLSCAVLPNRDVACNRVGLPDSFSCTTNQRREDKSVQTVDNCFSYASDAALLSSISSSTIFMEPSETDDLKNRLTETIAVCKRLVQSLNARNQNVHVASSDALVDQESDEMTQGVWELENALKCNSNAVEDDHYQKQIAMLENRLKEMERANMEWQQYAEQRDQYARVLAQRYSKLDQTPGCRPPSLHQLNEEQQRKIDRLLLEHRHKLEIIDQEKIEIENENRLLKAANENLTYEKQDMNARFVVAATRLKASKARLAEATERIQVLETQVAVYGEDFETEQRDRRLAQQRVAELERELEAVKSQLRIANSEANGQPFRAEIQQPAAEPIHRRNQDYHAWGQRDSSIPLLIARGMNTPVVEAGDVSDRLDTINWSDCNE